METNKRELKPKLKDNNIIIKKTKDSWSREEVVAILFKTMDYNLTPDCIEQWIEENL